MGAKSTACEAACHETFAAGDPPPSAARRWSAEVAVARLSVASLSDCRRPRTTAERTRLHRQRARAAGLVPVQVMVPAAFRDVVLLVGRILREAAGEAVPGTGKRLGRYRAARLRLLRHLVNLRTEVLREGEGDR